MTMNNSTYWVKRAAKRMIEYQSEADAVADEVAKAYVRATKAINAEMYKIFNTFTFESGLSESEVRDLLNKKASRKTLNKFKAALETVEEPKERREMINAINAPAYAHRIGRFETLQKNIDVQTANLATFEENVTKRHYVDLADEAYNRCVFDIQKGTGLNFSFAKMPVSKVSEILNNKWSGQLFSERIWGKTDEINKVLKEELLVGFMTGRGYKKTAKEIEGRMAVGAMEARRLVRTESAYISSMAEMESYKELGVDKYKFVATLDMRTSAVCQSLDGKKFKISEGVPGVNMPPMHPWCRSTTVPAIDSSAEKSLTRRAKDPVTGKTQKVPANMTYEKWRKSLDSTYGDGTWETERKKLLNEKSDKQQYRSYKSVLGKENVPETFDKFREMKYNDGGKWSNLKSAYRYVVANEGADINAYRCVSELKEIIRYGSFHIPPQGIKYNELEFDGAHINKERNHKVSKDDAIRYIETANVSHTVWKGQFRRYYSYDGVAYVDTVKKEIRTAYSNNEFDDNVKQVVEVLKKYGY